MTEPTVTILQPSGALEISDIIDGYIVSRVYHGRSAKEAVALFMKEAREATQ